MSISIINCIFFFLLSSAVLIQPIYSSAQKSRLLSPSPSPSLHIHRSRKHKHKHNYPSNLFFPSDPSPPPSAANSLPANVSSPTLSNTTTSTNSSSKLVAVVISLSVFLVVVIALAAVIIFRRDRRNNTETKVDRSDSIRLHSQNTSVSDSKSPPPSLLFDSPELRPLPLLPKENLSDRQYYYNTTYEGTREEEFFSPIGFSGSPNAAVSSSGSVNGPEILRSRSLNSEISSYPSSRSISYSQTISRCASIASNSTASINFPATFRPRELRISTESPPPQRNSIYSHNSDEFTSYGPVNLPPIPSSLPPPPRFSHMWQKIQGSPELEIPGKPSTELQTLGKNNEFGETSDQNVKRKLKALHWDKVRTSSDRAMVWDKLKSTSFQ